MKAQPREGNGQMASDPSIKEPRHESKNYQQKVHHRLC